MGEPGLGPSPRAIPLAQLARVKGAQHDPSQAAVLAQNVLGDGVLEEDIPLGRRKKRAAGSPPALGSAPSTGPDSGGTWPPSAPLCDDPEPDPELDLSQLPLKALKRRLESPTVPPGRSQQPGPSPAAPLHPPQPPPHPAQAFSPSAYPPSADSPSVYPPAAYSPCADADDLDVDAIVAQHQARAASEVRPWSAPGGSRWQTPGTGSPFGSPAGFLSPVLGHPNSTPDSVPSAVQPASDPATRWQIAAPAAGASYPAFSPASVILKCKGQGPQGGALAGQHLSTQMAACGEVLNPSTPEKAQLLPHDRLHQLSRQFINGPECHRLLNCSPLAFPNSLVERKQHSEAPLNAVLLC